MRLPENTRIDDAHVLFEPFAQRHERHLQGRRNRGLNPPGWQARNSIVNKPCVANCGCGHSPSRKAACRNGWTRKTRISFVSAFLGLALMPLSAPCPAQEVPSRAAALADAQPKCLTSTMTASHTIRLPAYVYGWS